MYETTLDKNLSVKNLRCEYKTSPLGIDAANPRLSWIIESNRRGFKQTAYQIIVAGCAEDLENDAGDLWDSGKTDSDQSVHILYNGKPLTSQMRCFWKVRVWDSEDKASDWSEPAWWEIALTSPEDWTGSWINDGKATPQKDEDFYTNDPAPLFRKQFSVTKKIKRARLYISGLGYYDACLNGEKVGDYVLDPGWTDYSKRVLYSTYDVTSLLSEGQNVIAAMLGNGWYNPLPMKLWGWLNLREHLTIGRPRLIAQLNIDFTDGTQQSVTTDESWKVCDGPILRNNVYLGEVYDARLEKEGWDKPGFDDSKWNSAGIAGEPLGPLCAQPQQPIKATAKIRPVKITEPKPGIFIFDMGQNFAGWATLHVKGPAGTKVKLRYGELLYPDGTLNVMTSVCGQIKPDPNEAVDQARPGYAGPGAPELADQSDTYILKGQGTETYTPRFTFRAFRYLELTGLPDKPTLDNIEGWILNSAVESVGSFSCSNQMFNDIQQMVRRTLLSNIFSVQSDCSHREKFGYGGDIVACGEMAMMNFDMASFYEKAVYDFQDTVMADGSMAECAPFNGIIDREPGEKCGPVGWVLAHPYLQQQLYRYYGNKQIIQQQYQTTKKLVEFLRTTTKDNIIEIGISDHESLDPRPTALTSTAFYYHNAKLLSQLAQIIGHDEEAKKYLALAEEIKEAFISKFLKPGTGQFDSHTQACQTFALYYDMVPANERKAAIDVLLREILVTHKGHLSTGIFGTKYMLDVLTEIGRADLAYTIVNQKTFPGWGHMLENDATTLWEHWEFSDNVYSHNHPMFGSVSEWFFKAIAGINPGPDAVGFDKIIIRPQIVGDLTWAKGSYNSIHGKIASDWRTENDTLHLNVTIPANTTATVYVPTSAPDSITESGKPTAQIEDLKALRTEADAAIYEVGSGDYSFTAKLVRNGTANGNS